MQNLARKAKSKAKKTRQKRQRRSNGGISAKKNGVVAIISVISSVWRDKSMNDYSIENRR